MKKILIFALALVLISIAYEAAPGSSKIREVTVTNLTDYCGDGICQDTENPSNCWEDCRINYDSLVTCLWEDDLPCNWDQNWFPVALMAVLIGVVGIIVYQFEKKGKRGKR
jgi:hypothetical protein